MTYSHLDPAMQNRVAWNAGKTVGTKRPLTQKQIWAIRFFLDREARLRDRARFDLAIESKLRGCDHVKLKTGDLVVRPDGRLAETPRIERSVHLGWYSTRWLYRADCNVSAS